MYHPTEEDESGLGFDTSEGQGAVSPLSGTFRVDPAMFATRNANIVV